ncbi:MAG: amidohydrolase family protein [Armatimonadota bacterium]|jgi:predicted TIM-barrel fold metal-dependent hydrolase
MVIDCHVHVQSNYGTEDDRMGYLLEYADRVGIDRLCLSLGTSRDHRPSVDTFRRDNDMVRDAIELHPDRYIGFCYLNPCYLRESLDEIERCIVDGPFVGIKLWIALYCNEPNLDPICERAAELGAPVLQHTWLKITGNNPHEPTPFHLAELAARHPDVSFILGHSGGNWEMGYRIVEDLPNVYAEVAGGDPELGQTEMGVAMLGADRIVYGSDAPGRSFASQIAKVHGADISAEDRAKILGGNVQRMLGL